MRDRDTFGSQVLLSDTNKDGKADLTATAPLEDGTYADSGAAWHLRGAAGGLTVTGITSFGPKALGALERVVIFGSWLAR
ncbi:FG-GAP repeat protein [Streptomyces sp. NPDC054887]